MNDTLTALAGLLGGTAGAALVSGIFAAVSAKRSRKKGLESAVRFLLQQSIKAECLACISRGSITAEELELLTEAHRAYHDDLGGNGYLDQLMSRVSQLPLE